MLAIFGVLVFAHGIGFAASDAGLSISAPPPPSSGDLPESTSGIRITSPDYDWRAYAHGDLFWFYVEDEYGALIMDKIYVKSERGWIFGPWSADIFGRYYCDLSGQITVFLGNTEIGTMTVPPQNSDSVLFQPYESDASTDNDDAMRNPTNDPGIEESYCKAFPNEAVLVTPSDFEIKGTAPVQASVRTMPFGYGMTSIALDIEFPCYDVAEGVDLYVAILTPNPDGELLFISPNGDSTESFEAMAIGATENVSMTTTIWGSVRGMFSIFWAILPSNGGDLLAGQWDQGSIVGTYPLLIE